MSTNMITKWIREEHDKVEDLMDRLREKVAVVPRNYSPVWLDEVRRRFESFRAHLQKHMALEEHDGYLSAVVEHRPTLSDQVERLKHEHREFQQMLDDIHRAFEAIKPGDRLLVRDCCRRIQHLLTYVEHHEDDENLLVTYAFTQDIGTKD